MEKRFKCSYCGRMFEEMVPHKCTDGFRKHHLKFKNMNPTDEEILEDLKVRRGIPKEAPLSEIPDILSRLGIGVSVRYLAFGPEDSGWMMSVYTIEPESNQISQDLTMYPSFDKALLSACIEALSYLELIERS